MMKTEGIIIRTQDYGESNKIITVLTQGYGKISLMARGARKMKSRLSSVVQLFTYGQFLFFKGSAKSMGNLSQGEVIHSFRDLRQDLTKTAYAAYCAEWMDKVLTHDEPGGYAFQLLLQTFEYLAEDKNASVLARLFEMKMLTLAGYKPQVDACVRCGRQEGHFGFSVPEGGFLCDHCLVYDRGRLEVSPGTLKLLRLFYYFELSRLGEISVKKETSEELRQVLWAFIDYHTPLRFKSRAFLEQMDDFLH
jgi:DNA repair protein RecO (recombination protein O)